MPTDKEQKEITAKVQGKDKQESFADAAKQISKDFDKSNESSSKSIKDKLSENAQKQFESFKEMSRPGSLIKSVGLMTGSPIIMSLGDKLNDTVDSIQQSSADRKEKEESLIESLQDQGYNSEEIQSILKMNGKSNEEIATTLEEIRKNSEPDFTAEELADEQVARDEKQLSFLEKMVEGLNSLGDKIGDMSAGTGFADILALAGLTLAVVLAPFALIAGFFTGLKDSIKLIIKTIMNPIKSIKKLFSFKGLDLIDDVAKEIPKKISRISKLFSKIVTWFKTSEGLFSKILKKAFRFGKFFGKLFPFIQIITGIFDTITGAIAGFKEEGIVGAIKGGIKGLLNGLIFGLLDMVKDGISWLAGWFGFENIKTTLDSFSFVEMFNSLVDTIFSSFNSVIEYLKGLFAWEKSEEPFNLSNFLSEKLDNIFSWIKGLFSFDIKSIIDSLDLPDWAKNRIPGYKDTKENNIEEKPIEKKKSFWGWGKDTPEPATIKEPVLLSTPGIKNIPAIEREQQLAKKDKIEKDSLVQNNVDNSTVNNISAVDMSFESPDRSLSYAF